MGSYGLLWILKDVHDRGGVPEDVLEDVLEETF